MTEDTETATARATETKTVATSPPMPERVVANLELAPVALGFNQIEAGITPEATTGDAVAAEVAAKAKDLAAKIDALHHEHFHGTALGNDVVLWNMVMKFKEAVKVEIATATAAIKFNADVAWTTADSEKEM